MRIFRVTREEAYAHRKFMCTIIQTIAFHAQARRISNFSYSTPQELHSDLSRFFISLLSPLLVICFLIALFSY